MSSETALRAAAKVYLGVVAALGERVPGESFNYFEASLSNAEAYNRWLALNEAGKVLKAAIEASATPPPPAGSRPEDAGLRKALTEACDWIENRLAVEGHPMPSRMSLLLGWREALSRGKEVGRG